MAIGGRHIRRHLPAVLFLSTVLLQVQAQRIKKPATAADTVQQLLQTQHKRDSLLKATGAADTIIPYLVNKIELLSGAINGLNAFYHRGFDTSDISTSLPKVERGILFFKQYLADHGRQLNLRSLNNSNVLVQESIDRLTGWQKALFGYSDRLSIISTAIHKISQDSVLKALPADSTLFQLSLLQLKEIDRKYKEADSLQRMGVMRISVLQNRVANSYLLATDLLDEVTYRTRVLKNSLWGQEESPMWSTGRREYNITLWHSLVYSVGRSFQVMRAYTLTTWDNRSLGLVLFVALLVWCMVNLRKVRAHHETETIFAPVHFLHRLPVISCLLLLTTYEPYFYTNLSMTYQHYVGVLQVATLCLLLYHYLTPVGRKFGLLLVILWFFYAMDDLLMEASLGERWLQLLGAIVTSCVCVQLLRNKKALFVGLEEPTIIKSMVWVALVQSVLAFCLNLAGRNTLARLLGVSSVHSLVCALALWIFALILLEALYLQSEAYKETRFSAFLNFDDLQHRLKYYLWMAGAVAWLISLTRFLSIYDSFFDVAAQLINKQRSLGSITFSYKSVVIFVLIIWISSVLSQFISYFFGGPATQPGKRNRTGSIMLLVRLAVLGIGFIIAFGAAGIPLDKISLIIGALGVGIGFGLQNIVNNLVSGIILAFERPIQIGDAVEVGNKSGTVKEIGIRSSKLDGYEGAVIIIPNGDLLSQQLVNWTLTDRHRRQDIVLNVPYGTDLKKAMDIIDSLLRSHKDVMENPGPIVQLNKFGSSAIELQAFFWAYDINTAGILKTDVIIQVGTALANEGISIAFPAQDVYIRGVGDAEKELSPELPKKTPPDEPLAPGS